MSGDKPAKQGIDDLSNQSGTFKLAIKYILTVIVIYFLLDYIKKTTSSLDLVRLVENVDHAYFIASLILSILYVLNYSIVWQYITVKFDCNIPLAYSFEARFYSEFCKYVPGKALSLATIVYYYNKKGVSKTKVSVCLAFEAIITVISSILVFLVSIQFSDMQVDVKYKLIASVLALTLIVMIHPRIFNYLLKMFFSLTNIVPINLEFRYSTLLKILLLYSLNWTLAGVSFYCLIKSFQPVSGQLFSTLNGICALSGFIGFVSIMTPAGLGVKEASMLFFLSALLPKGVASIATVLSRLWLVAAELVLLAGISGYFFVNRTRRLPQRPD